MAFAYVLKAHATYGGLYYTANFTATGTQPTWSKITTTGLPALDTLTWLTVDPFNPRDRQVVLGGTSLYGRNGGNWSLLLDNTIASAAVGGTVSETTSPWFDTLVEGKLIALSKADTTEHWVLVSTDYGANWTAFRMYGGDQLNEIKSFGTYYWEGANGNVGVPNYRTAYTADGGSTLKFAANQSAGAAAGPPVIADKATPTICYGPNYNGSDHDLIKIDGATASPMTKTVMQAHIADRLNPTTNRGDNMWIDPYDNTHMRLLSTYNGLANPTLKATTNTWTSLTSGTALGYGNPGALTHIQNTGDTTVVVLGDSTTGGTSIATLSTETDYTPEARDGANATVAPYTDSIPRVSGSTLAYYGIWVGEQPVSVGVYVYADEQESDDNAWSTDIADYAKLGSPMGGDRASFRDMNADGLDVYHAQDIHAATPQRHNPWPAASGEAPVSDGTKYVATDIATQAELNTHAGTPSAHHDPVTLDADAATILDLSTQEIGLDTQSANTVLAGPTTGVANEPTFRALVEADIDEILPLDKLSDVNTSGTDTGDIIYNTGAGWEDYPLGIGTNVTRGAGEIRFGDTANGHYVSISDDSGETRLHGNARQWDDLQVTVVIRNTGAATRDPGFTKWFDDSGGTSRGVYVYGFEDEAVNEKELTFTMQMAHRQDTAADVHIHVHWIGDSNAVGAQVRWGLEYCWKSPLQVFGDTTIIYADTVEGGDTDITQYKHYLTEFAALTPDSTQNDLSSIIIGRLFRNSSNAGDTYTGGVAGLLAIDAHILIDSFGSVDEYQKYESDFILLESGDATLLENGDNLLLEA